MKNRLILTITILAATALNLYSQTPSITVAPYRGDKACATSFTFDDGLPEHLSVVAPELEKRGWRGTFWVCGAKVNGEKKKNKDFLSWEDIRELHMRGHEVSNHGWSHKKLSRLTPEQIHEEVHKNDSAIFANTGKKPLTFCYPYNSKNEEILKITEAGRSGTRTRQYAFGEAVDEAKTIRRMQDAVRKKDWAVWMTHGISHGYDAFKDTTRFSRFLDYIKTNEKDIWVGTFHEVASYIKERDAVVLDVMQKGRHLHVTPTLDLDPEIFDQTLTLVIDTESRKISARQGRKRLSVIYCEGKVLLEFDPYSDTIKIRL